MEDVEKLGLRRRAALELAHQLVKNLRKEHPLRQLFWESTVRCNIFCRHCGSDCKMEGVVPYMQLNLDDEDSLSPQLEQTKIEIGSASCRERV